MDNQTDVDRANPFLRRAKEMTFKKHNVSYVEPVSANDAQLLGSSILTFFQSPHMWTSYAALLMVGQVSFRRKQETETDRIHETKRRPLQCGSLRLKV